MSTNDRRHSDDKDYKDQRRTSIQIFAHSNAHRVIRSHSGNSTDSDHSGVQYNPGGHRRGSISTSFQVLNAKFSAEKVRQILFKNVDEEEELEISGHKPVFCQMNVLYHFDSGDMGWKEQSRWLKYEEKVDAGDRWSKPHVSTTSLHALFEVHRCLADKEALLMLDFDTFGGCVHKTAEKLANALITHYGLHSLTERQLCDILLSPHKHKHRKGTNINALAKGKEDNCNNDTGVANTSIASYIDGSTPDTLKAHMPNKKFMKKFLHGTEVANILVGQVDIFTKPVMLLARLTEPSFLGDWTEVHCPTKFIFLCMGPLHENDLHEYEEVGRAVGSLFTDKVFREVAYKACNRQEILDGIDEFVDNLTVLPPSIWDPTTRLEPPDSAIDDGKIAKRLVGSDRYTLAKDNMDLHGASHDDPTLKRTGRLFGGMWNDIKRRYPEMLSDYKDGIHLQCLACVIFLYFACITPIITFGGLMGSATDNYMGTMESMLSGALCGVIYHLFAGQPLTIVGATGPMLVFESILYQLCVQYEWEFLSFRFFVGTWIAIILLLFVAFDLSSLVAYITRFTEESFSVLISLIFIVEAFKKAQGILKYHPVHIDVIHEAPGYKCHCIEAMNTTTELPLIGTTLDLNTTYVEKPQMFETFNYSLLAVDDCINIYNQLVVSHDCISTTDCTKHGWELDGPACENTGVVKGIPDTFLTSLFLFIGTFAIAYVLRLFRNSDFFPTFVRNFVADFAVFISILICCAIDIVLALDTPKLEVPADFKPSRNDRGWVVNPANITYWWLILLALIPAILATILVFLDQQITAVIVNRKAHMLKKGHGYHLDLCVIGILIFICSLLGLPWFVAATVRSITHVKALLKQSEHRAPGEKPRFLGVREQRLTGVCIHIIIGCSVLLTVILKYIPMPVLYGVFLYMGVTSLFGVQFYDRILILFMPLKYQPDYKFLRNVSIVKVHIFTAIQVLCMVVMWTVKSINTISIAFPMMVLAICFVRKAMELLFTQNELFWLDHLLPLKDEKDEKDQSEDNGDDTEKVETIAMEERTNKKPPQNATLNGTISEA